MIVAPDQRHIEGLGFDFSKLEGFLDFYGFFPPFFPLATTAVLFGTFYRRIVARLRSEVYKKFFFSEICLFVPFLWIHPFFLGRFCLRRYLKA